MEQIIPELITGGFMITALLFVRLYWYREYLNRKRARRHNHKPDVGTFLKRTL